MYTFFRIFLCLQDPYEIIGDSVNGFAHRGPTRARLSHVPLFKNFEIHVVGESSELPQGRSDFYVIPS